MESEEVVFRRSTPNDIRVSREFVAYAADKLRAALKEHDYHESIPTRYLSEISGIVSDFEVGVLFFQDKNIVKPLRELMVPLEKFANHMAAVSTPVHGGPMSRIISNYQYARYSFNGELPDFVREEIRAANKLSTTSWKRLEELVRAIKSRVPEAFDEPISYDWIRSRGGE